MSYANAMAEAQKLAACIRARGVAVSIELQVDTRGTWDVFTKKGVLSHHTASWRSQGATPFLAFVKRGKTGVPGPLCNGYGGRDFVYRIITMGKANHAGTGGPISLAGLISKDNGNSLTWGTEYEGGYESWTDEERAFMAKANAGLLDYFGFNVEGHGEHKTYAPGRKIDRIDYTTATGLEDIITLGGKGGAVAPQPPASPANPWAGKNVKEVHAPGSRSIYMYSAGTDVSYAQAVIGATVDGAYGPESVAKTRAFQIANGLDPDGAIGKLTWPVIIAKAGGAPKPSGSLVIDGDPGKFTITRLQSVMGTPQDGVFSKPSTAIKAVQNFLNATVDSGHIKNLTGSSKLAVVGTWTKSSVKVLQFYLFNKYSSVVLGRPPVWSDFDGNLGPASWKLFQYALNNASSGSKRF